MSGWIKLNRCLLNNTAWRECTPVQNRILITLMLRASYKPEKRIINGCIVELAEGQLATTVKGIVDMCECSEVTVKKVRTALKLFESAGIIKVEATECYTLITIVNTDEETEKNTNAGTVSDTESQKESKDANTAQNAALTADETDFSYPARAKDGQAEGKEGAKDGQAMGKERALIKEINNKELNKYNNKIMCASTHTQKADIPELEQVRLYIDENGIKADAERFFYHYGSVGWMMGRQPITDWKAALRKWSVNGLDKANTAPNTANGGEKQASGNTASKNTRFEQRTYTEEELERAFSRE